MLLAVQLVGSELLTVMWYVTQLSSLTTVGSVGADHSYPLAVLVRTSSVLPALSGENHSGNIYSSPLCIILFSVLVITYLKRIKSD
jgi:hypothetical protein